MYLSLNFQYHISSNIYFFIRNYRQENESSSLTGYLESSPASSCRLRHKSSSFTEIRSYRSYFPYNISKFQKNIPKKASFIKYLLVVESG